MEFDVRSCKLMSSVQGMTYSRPSHKKINIDEWYKVQNLLYVDTHLKQETFLQDMLYLDCKTKTFFLNP